MAKCLKKSKLPKAFINDIADIITNPYVSLLRNYTHHKFTNRFCHSLNVAYLSWRICNFLHLNSKSAARGAMLHDLYLYNRSEYIRTKGEAFHNARHPKIAYKNAKRLFKLNRIEADCILSHMFPAVPRAPVYLESIIVSLCDKLCAARELFGI